MVRFVKIAAVAGCALVLSTFSVLAQEFALPDIDIDPFHILTPAAPSAAPAAAAHHHHHGHHHAAKG